jgi:uncharacterized protein (DUF362 family)
MADGGLDRREFLRSIAIAGLAATCSSLMGCGRESGKDEDSATSVADRAQPTATQAKRTAAQDMGLVIASGGDDPKRLVKAAVDAAGGMASLVRRGDVVVVKPNIGWSRTPEQAANTNPFVVEGIVEMCLDAGAKKVKVFDRPCNPAQRTYRMSGIEDAVKRAGGDIYYMDERKFKNVTIAEGEMLKSWKLYSEALEADVLINVPILKHHSLARLTMGMKNLMGLMGGRRESIHVHFDQKLADINTVIRPHLTILDAYRVLKAHGPNSGTPEDVWLAGHIVVGTDPIAVDAYGARLFGEVTGQNISGGDLGYVAIGHSMGLGELDLDKVEQKEVMLT